jgi:hypothetical protein
MKVTLPSEKRIVLRQAEAVNIIDITIMAITDNPSQKKVTCVTKELGLITLWEGSAYDSIGQWTDSDVEDKIKDLYK